VGWPAGGGGPAEEVARAGRCDKASRSAPATGGSGGRLGRRRGVVRRSWGRERTRRSHRSWERRSRTEAAVRLPPSGLFSRYPPRLTVRHRGLSEN
jgi:hypothetical protein